MGNVNQFTQLCVWPSCLVLGLGILPGSAKAIKEIKKFEDFMAQDFKGTRVKYAEEVKTLPTPGEPGTGGRNDIFFYVHSEDLSKFAIVRLVAGIRWWEDVVENNNHILYPKEILDKYWKEQEPVKPIEKPKVKLSGQNGNVFNLMGLCSRALKIAGQPENATKMIEECKNSGSYDDALQVMMKYCDVN